jgi:hypothetical protein
VIPIGRHYFVLGLIFMARKELYSEFLFLKFEETVEWVQGLCPLHLNSTLFCGQASDFLGKLGLPGNDLYPPSEFFHVSAIASEVVTP